MKPLDRLIPRLKCPQQIALFLWSKISSAATTPGQRLADYYSASGPCTFDPSRAPRLFLNTTRLFARHSTICRPPPLCLLEQTCHRHRAWQASADKAYVPSITCCGASNRSPLVEPAPPLIPRGSVIERLFSPGPVFLSTDQHARSRQCRPLICLALIAASRRIICLRPTCSVQQQGEPSQHRGESNEATCCSAWRVAWPPITLPFRTCRPTVLA